MDLLLCANLSIPDPSELERPPMSRWSFDNSAFRASFVLLELINALLELINASVLAFRIKINQERFKCCGDIYPPLCPPVS